MFFLSFLDIFLFFGGGCRVFKPFAFLLPIYLVGSQCCAFVLISQALFWLVQRMIISPVSFAELVVSLLPYC
jgi:hypothetical protein